MTHSTGFLAIVNDAKSRVKQIDIEGYRKMQAAGEPHVLVDVIERDIEAKVPDKHTRLVLYCGGGYRSALAADSLQKMGYTDAISLDGGWKAWQQAGLPVA